MKKLHIKKSLFITLAVIFIFGCKGDAELSMERGIQYYEWNMVDKAILEFNHVVHILSVNSPARDYKKVQLLARAHHNLSVAYAKKEWYQVAEKEARTAFNLYPSSDNRKVLELIQENLPGKTDSDDKKKESSR